MIGHSMINKKCTFILLLFFFSFKASALSIAAYSISSLPFLPNNDGVVPCYLDVDNNTLMAINKNILPENNINLSELKIQLNPQFQAISDEMTCAFNAKQLGIQKLPAIVFDGKYVVYGINDISLAKNIFNHYRGDH